MPLPEAIEAIESFRRRLLALDEAAATELVQAYEPVFRRLVDRTDTLIAQIENQQMTFGQVQRLQRFQSLRRQILLEMERYATAANGTISEAQRRAMELAQASTRTIANRALPRGLNLNILAQAGIEWNALPAGAFESFVGIAGDGAPLGNLLAELGPTTQTGVTNTLKEGIAVGRGPRETARLIRNQYGMPLTRSLRISRTETLRAHRESTRANYANNRRIVTGYTRRARQDATTCMACIALDGKHYRLDQPLDEHVNGRCALVPVTVTYRDLGLDVDQPVEEFEDGRAWFRRQPAGLQRAQMGPGKFDAWKEGKFDLEDMAQVNRDPVWGDQATVKTLKALVR